jgi:hypothetical protein
VRNPPFHSKKWVDPVFLFSPSNKNRGKAFAVPSKKRLHHLFFGFVGILLAGT